MEYREVGNTGIRISEIGFGGGGNAGLMIKGTHEQQREAIQRALELGINYFDQSPDYGDGVSESNMGRVFKELDAHPYLTTKVEVRDADRGDIAGHVERSLDASLERLGVEQVDFFQVHNGPTLDDPHITGAGYAHLWIEDYLKPGGALEGLQRVLQAGKAKHIGFITRGNDFEPVKQLIDTGLFSLINVSVHLLNPSAGVMPPEMKVKQDWGGVLAYAASKGVGAAIYSALSSGFLTDAVASGGAFHPLARGARNAEEGERLLRQVQAFSFLSKSLNPDQEDDHSLEEAAMRYVLSLEGVTTLLGGFSDVAQVEANAAVSGRGPLSAANMARIEEVWRSGVI